MLNSDPHKSIVDPLPNGDTGLSDEDESARGKDKVFEPLSNGYIDLSDEEESIREWGEVNNKMQEQVCQ